MKINITKENLRDWIQIYYRKQMNMKVDVNFQVQKDRDFYGESYGTVAAEIKSDVEILGEKYPVTETLGIDEIKRIVGSILAETEFDLEYFYFDFEEKTTWDGIRQRSDIYYDLNGAVLTVERKTHTTNISLHKGLFKN